MTDDTSKRNLIHHLDAMTKLEHKQAALLSHALQCVEDPHVRDTLQNILDQEIGHEDQLHVLNQLFRCD